MENLEARTIRKVSARLIPFLMICYFVAYLDRVNVGFAALTMNKSLGLTATMFGFGSGIFFLTYFLFEVPSNLALDRFGARKWIARIMFSWGILSGADGVHSGIARATGLEQRDHLLHLARAARLRRSRFLSRHHLLSDAVVSVGLSRPHRRRCSWRRFRSPRRSARRFPA